MKPNHVPEWNGLPVNPSETTRRLNPHLYGVRAVEAGRAEQTSARALDRNARQRESCPECVAFRVVLVALRRRLLDPDAVAFACKPLTDIIAKEIGLDDADPRLVFEYHQCKSDAEEGVLVKIEQRISDARRGRAVGSCETNTPFTREGTARS